jgi:copper resistance protein C
MYRLRHLSVAFFVMLLGCGFLFFASAGTASAHAKVISATPGIGSTIATAPTKVTVVAVENINPDPKLSNLFVYSPAGDLISQGNATVPLNNPKQMSIPIKPTGDGIYIVRWITVSADDGDPDQGAFVFTVKPGAAATTSGNTTSSAAPAASSNSLPIVPVAIAAVVALVIGLGVGLDLGRRSARTAAAQATSGQEPSGKETSTPHAP